jgi:membrane-bound lytic murein transglycosylase B
MAGNENFYAITRHNWSRYCAMTMIDWADALAREVQTRP